MGCAPAPKKQLLEKAETPIGNLYVTFTGLKLYSP